MVYVEGVDEKGNRFAQFLRSGAAVTIRSGYCPDCGKHVVRLCNSRDRQTCSHRDTAKAA